MMGLPPGTTTTSSGVAVVRRVSPYILSDGLAQPWHRRKVRSGESLVQGVASRLDDVARGIEIGFPISRWTMSRPLASSARFHPALRGGLGAETRHAFREAEFTRCGLIHDG
jgi:hypothetical protein